MKKILFITLFLFSCSKSSLDLPEFQLGSRYPRVTSNNDGGLLMSWYEKIDSVNWSINWSEFYDGEWSKSKPITSGRSYFVNWADFQSIYHFGGDSLSAHWLETSGSGPYDYDVKVVTSIDRGKTWSKPNKPHNDGVKGEHGFLSFFKNLDNRLSMIWLDGRNMSSDHSSHGYGAMNLYQTSFDSNGQLLAEAKIDDRVCECCPTSATRTTNSVILAYRDRDESEIRDISIVRCTKNECFDPYPVNNDNWKIAGCPVNGPKLAVTGNNVAAVWYTSPNENPIINISFSKDGGNKFNSPIRIDNGNPIGRVDCIWLDSDRVLVSWMEMGEKSTNVIFSTVDIENHKGSSKIVTQILPGRSSGHPVISRYRQNIFLAWTEEDKIQSKWIHVN